MALTKWNYGIDWGTNSNGTVPFAGWFFVDLENGDDSTGTGEPLTPWKTPSFAKTQTSVGNSIVMSKGDYDMSSFDFSDRDYYGNQKKSTILNGNNTFGGSANNSSLNNLTIYNFSSWCNNGGWVADNVDFDNCPTVIALISGGFAVVNCVFIDSPFAPGLTDQKGIKNCRFFNSDLSIVHNNVSSSVTCDIIDNSFDINSELIINWTRTDAGAPFDQQVSVVRSNIRGGLSETGDSVYQEDNGDVSLGIIGDKEKGQYIAILTSDSIGFNGKDSGSLKTGYLLKDDTVGYGVGADTNTGVSFDVNGVISITGMEKEIVTARISFDQLRTAPTFNNCGLQKGIIADSDMDIITPDPNVFELKYTPLKNGTLSAYFVFQFGLPLLFDDSNKSTGDPDYNPNTEQTEIEIFDFVARLVYRDKYGAAPFVLEVETTVINEIFKLPLVTGELYDFAVDWGDGNTEIVQSDIITHQYSSPGIRNISISPALEGFPRFAFDDEPMSKDNLRRIISWGDLELFVDSFEGMFSGCSNLLSCTSDALKLKTSIGRMFRLCTSVVSFDFSNWDVTDVVTASSFMNGSTSLISADVTGWDTGNVNTFLTFASGCPSLESLNVSGWDMSSVTTLERMVLNCSNISVLDASSWITSSLSNCKEMIKGCGSLNDFNPSGWDVTQLNSASGFMKSTGTTTAIYNDILENYAAQLLNSGVPFHAGNSNYTTSTHQAFKDILEGVPNNWVITDGGGV